VRTVARLCIIVLVISILAPLGQQSGSAQQTASDLRYPRYFDATGFWLQGPFRQYWESNGGLYIFGYPITGVFHDDGLYKQYFERAVFEYHPELAGTRYEVLLQRLGAIRTEGRELEEPFIPISAQSDADCTFYPETGHRLCFGFRNFWESHGGLPNFGYPLSEEFDEQNQPPPAGDGEVHTVQYFERTRFEYHPELAGTPYEVLLGLLGTEHLLARGVPSGVTDRQDPTLPPPDPTTGALHGPHAGYGFNAFMRGDERPDRHDFNQRAIDLSRDAGFMWLHFQVQWSQFEVSPGSYEPAPLDRIIEQTHANGMKVLLSVVGPSPSWANAGGGIPENTDSFVALTRFLADRYQGRIHAWEIWNEQNLASNVGGYVDVAPYVALLRAGYQGVKEGDPNAIVLFGALTPTGVNIPSIAIDDVAYLQLAYAWNDGEIRNYFDVLGAHPGSNNNPPDTMWPGNPGPGEWSTHGSFYFRRIEQLRQVMVDNGDAAKQIWLTEFGWTTFNQEAGYEYGADNSEQDQARYLVRAFEIAKAEWPWMGVMFVWSLNYSVITDAADEKHPWSVLYEDWSPRPSYTALKDMPK
jgi:polysaccharide biosynthesis protein PslG